MTLVHGQAILGEELETAFSRPTPQRFASLCNAVAYLSAGCTLAEVPSFSERVNVKDKGIDAELRVEVPGDGPCASPYLGPGLNILQFKQREVLGKSRSQTVAGLKSELKGALKYLAAATGNRPDRYVVFTNVDLSHKHKADLKKAVVDGYLRADETHVEIVGAAELAAALNGLPHVRSGYFATGSFSTWQDAKRRHTEANVLGGAVKFVGRGDKLATLRELVDEAGVRAIVLTGPHNIGKSRLVLEATAHRFLDVVIALGGHRTTPADLASMIAPQRRTVVVAEDLDVRELELLVKYVLGAPELKLVATLPLSEGSPDPNFGRDARACVVPLGPLSESASRELLRAAGARLDVGIEEWVVHQAGGNPGILLAAAKAGPELRRTAAKFGHDVATAFAKRARVELGETALDALEVLSLMTHVGVAGQAGRELTLLCKLFGGPLDEQAIVRLLPRLGDSGLLKRTGPFVEVSPPFFANYLAVARLRRRGAEIVQVLAGLGSSGRDRLLRRLQSVLSEEAERFWAGLFGPDGPLRNLAAALDSPDLLGFVAAAVPERAASIIESGLEAMSQAECEAIRGEKRRKIMWALDELLFREETSSRALRALGRLAEAENDSYGDNATGVFGEAFHWNHLQLPLPLEERLVVLRDCTAPGASRKRRLVAITAIEAGLRQSAAIMLRRGSGAIPLDGQPRMTWGEVWDFKEALVDELRGLARSTDEVVATAALSALPAALQSIGAEGRLGGAIERMKEVVGWALEEGVALSIAKLTSALQFVRSRLADDAEQRDARSVPEVRAAVSELDALLGRIEKGDFGVRLKRWAGSSAWGDYEPDEQGRRGRERWDDELRALAREAAEDPKRVTPTIRDWLISSEAQRGFTFWYWLGRADASRRWLAEMEEWGKGDGDGLLASYLGGLAEDDPGFVSAKLDELTNGREVSGRAIVNATSYFAADEPALRRVCALLAEGRVDPEVAASALSGGRWLDSLTDLQFLNLLGAIAGPDLRYAVPVVEALEMWRYLGRLIDGSLAAFAWRCLESAPKVTANEAYHFDELAATLAPRNPERAFSLLERLLTQPRERGSWRPTDRYRPQGGFWAALRGLDRARALRIAFEAATRDGMARLEITWDLRELLDQAQDADILTAVAMETERQAELVTEALTAAKPGFWPIALRIAQKYPRAKRILQNLAYGIEQSGSSIQGPWSAHFERCRAEVREVLERERPSAGAAKWLREVEASLSRQAQSRLMAEAANDVNELRGFVENPAAPERLWAIRELVAAKCTAVLREILDRDELRQLIPKLGLRKKECDALRRELGL